LAGATAFAGATVDVDEVDSTVNHVQITPNEQPLQLGSAHFGILGERLVSDGSFTIIDVNDGKYVMNFADRHRFTFTLEDQDPNDGVDVVESVQAKYNRLDVEYRWLIKDLVNPGQWSDAMERYTIVPYIYQRVRDGSFVQTVNLNTDSTAVRTDRTGTTVTSFAVEDEITTSGLFIEDDLQLQITLTWSADYCKALHDENDEDGPMWCAAAVECEYRANSCQYNFNDCIELSPQFSGSTNTKAETDCNARQHCSWWGTCKLCGNTCDVDDDCPKLDSTCIKSNQPCNDRTGCTCSGGETFGDDLCPLSAGCPCLHHPDHERRRRLSHELAEPTDKTMVSLTIGFSSPTTATQDTTEDAGSDNNTTSIVLSVVFIIGVVTLAALHRSIGAHEYHVI